MRTYTIALITLSAVSLVACGGNRGPRERPPLSPERVERLNDRYIRLWDANKDGLVTCEDVTVRRMQVFEQVNTDGDIGLSPSEYRQVVFEDKSFLFYRFDYMDKDIDGSISLAEFSRIPQNEFNSADKNKDCMISAAEAAESLRDQFRERGRGREGENRRNGGGRQRPQRQGN